jgi:hypothetical protein
MSDANEKDIQDLIAKYNQQQSAFKPNPTFTGNPNQGIDPHQGIDNQGTVNESVPLTPGMMTPPKVHSPVPTGNVCPQCNMVHPPLRPNEKCPNATAKALVEESDDITIDINKYLTNLQTIMISQIQSKKIKDVKKLFENITIEITKYLEAYKE